MPADALPGRLYHVAPDAQLIDWPLNYSSVSLEIETVLHKYLPLNITCDPSCLKCGLLWFAAGERAKTDAREGLDSLRRSVPHQAHVSNLSLSSPLH